MKFIMTVVLVVEQPHFIDGIVRLYPRSVRLKKQSFLILILMGFGDPNGTTPDNSIIIFLKSSL